jgi:membrane fusion protein, multidrug efflux system
MAEQYPQIEREPPTTNRGEDGQKPRSRRGWIWILLALALAASVYYFGFRKPSSKSAVAVSPAAGGKARGFGATPVVAVKAVRGNIGVYLTDPGAVVPLHTVTVRTQISGYLMKVLYKEGDSVRAGDQLAQIDPRPYQVQLTQYEGQLIKDQANLANAQVDLQRYTTLVSHNAAPEQQLATQEATVKEDEGIVKTDQGLIDSAKLNLTYCKVMAPISGRVGLRLIDPGNYVTPNDSTGLVVITQLQPITVVFPIAEDHLPEVFSRWQKGQRLRVDAYDRAMTTKLATGSLETIDNQIDPTTGTVKLRATFSNQDNALFPNQFVNAKLLVEEKTRVTLLPTAAIQRNSQSTYVYRVKPDSTVTIQTVKVGTTEGTESEITSGLSPGDTVAMTGVDKLQEGSKVVVHLQQAQPAGASQ